jgi:hypothetical protein
MIPSKALIIGARHSIEHNQNDMLQIRGEAFSRLADRNEQPRQC